MYFSSGRKVPKAHRGGQSVHEGVAAPDPPPYPNTLRAHCRGAALITPRWGDVSSLGKALARHHIQLASSTGSLAWGLSPRRGDFAAAAASRRLRVAAHPSCAVTPAREEPCAGTPAWESRGPKALWSGNPEGQNAPLVRRVQRGRKPSLAAGLQKKRG